MFKDLISVQYLLVLYIHTHSKPYFEIFTAKENRGQDQGHGSAKGIEIGRENEKGLEKAKERENVKGSERGRGSVTARERGRDDDARQRRPPTTTGNTANTPSISTDSVKF